MKQFFTIILSLNFTGAVAQWTDTENKFLDTLHMAVSTAVGVQKNPLVLTSYPDGGYFVIWEDDRNAANKTDIYAQKYDKAGNRLWAADGVPIAEGPTYQHYTFSSNVDYRNRSFAATDSAGGFYICYSDDSVSNYVWERLKVQHVRPDGTGVFNDGYVFARSYTANLQFAGQLIPDGNKGFFLAYKQVSGNDYIQVYCYRDEGGRMQYYGGGRMNENAIQTSSIAACGIKTDVVYPGTNVIEYSIWSDLQGGCHVLIDMNGNIADQHRMLCYNRLWRAKKDSKSKTYFRNTSGSACPRTTEYFKGNVYPLYTVKTDYQTVVCGDLAGNIYVYTNYRLLSNGYILIDNTGYDYTSPKGITIPSSGTINVTMIAAATRTLTGNTLSDFYLKGYAMKDEKFDSIPYQVATYNNPDFGYNTSIPARVNKLNNFRDTLLAFGNYYFDFCLAGGGSDIYAAALMGTNVSNGRVLRLQHLALVKASADSFALVYDTNIPKTPEKDGVPLMKELSTGFSGSNLGFDLPIIKVTSTGKALFYVSESRGPRISPLDGSELQWGAMAKPIGSSYYNGYPYGLSQPVVALDSAGSTGIIAWRDGRNIFGGANYDNIFIQHLDKLDQANYAPPTHTVKLLPNPYGPTAAIPAVFYGRSRAFSTLEVKTGDLNPVLTPLADILDYNNLGSIRTGIYQHTTAIRRYNGEPYLNRNVTILPENSATGKDLTLMLYFTKEEFDALKTADPSIADPGYLGIVRQNNSTNNTPNTYSPVAGEEVVTPDGWGTTDGGYWVRISCKGLGDFFIKKMGVTTVCSSNTASFTSNISGSTYKWLVSTDGGPYLDIAPGPNYTGINTATLQLSNIPSSFSGNRYLCLVNGGLYSTAFYLQVGNTWTGAVNNAWENPGNWSCGKVPDASTDVVINSGTIVVSSNVSVRSLKVAPGVTVSVGTGFSITITN